MSLTRGFTAVFGGVICLLCLAQNDAGAQTLVAPGNLVATAVSSTQINLTWVDTNTTETGYSIYRKKGVNGTYALIYNVPANNIQYSDTGVQAGTQYSYEVRARKRIKSTMYTGPWSNEANATTPPATQVSSVILPLEALGAAGTTCAAQVNVASSVAPSVTQLWMQVHGLSYANKASVQVNSGAWVDLNNASVQVADPGKSYGGIGGVFSTLKMTLSLPTGAVVAGTNTVRFRFNGTDGLSMGFRVLAFNFLTNTGAMAVDASNFAQDDPTKWQPPYSDSTSIATGERLWRTASLIHSPIDSSVIQARCTDCHAQDGRDLKYFNYSNLSIIERSKYHGMTDLQGQLIASYIRTRPTVNPGRPWNPPYQPGPGTDAKPLTSWAAGAGLEWTLDRDQDSLQYLFPNGITKDAVATSNTLIMRELPIALQLPDWNHWLPSTHPKDAFGSIFYNSVLNKRYNGEGTGTIQYGSVMRQTLLGSNSLTYATWIGGLIQDLDRWIINDRKDVLGTLWDSQSTWTPAIAEQVYSVGQWQLVKTWELMQEFNLEGLGPEIFGSTGESHTWYTRMLFMTSPFMLGIRNNVSGTLSLDTLRSRYLSNAWYHLQVVADSGNRHRGGGNPVDWGYYTGFLSNLDQTTTLSSATRLTSLIVKAMQEGDNGSGPNFGLGWSPLSTGDPSILVRDDYAHCWNGVALSTRVPVTQAVLAAWFETSQKFTPQQYYNAGIYLADPTHVTINQGTSVYLDDRIWFMVPKMRSYGVDGTLLNRICDWAATIWPRANWASLKQ